MQSMGMSVAQLPGGEIVPAMERGVIDAFEFNNPSSDLRFGAPDVAENYYLASYHQASESFEFVFNRDFFETLEPDLQAILQHGVEGGLDREHMLALDNYSADLARISEMGVAVRRTPQEILAAQLQAWDALIAQARGGRDVGPHYAEPAGLGGARHLLRTHELARLSAGLQPLLPGPPSALSSMTS
jgi:TRAP-type mannitol/chloroaromatic compound transport system substrate-binding protein